MKSPDGRLTSLKTPEILVVLFRGAPLTFRQKLVMFLLCTIYVEMREDFVLRGIFLGSTWNQNIIFPAEHNIEL